jgi:TonB family protein
MTKMLWLLGCALFPWVCQWTQDSSFSDAGATAKAGEDVAIPRGMDTSAYQILSRNNGKDLRTYPDRVLFAVRQKWYPLIPHPTQSSDPQPATAVIEFTIHKDGSLGEMKNIESAGDPWLDAAAWSAITASAPFPPLPLEYHQKSLILRYSFGFNQQASEDRPLCGRRQGDVFRVSPGVQAPRVLYQPDPEYSEEARHGKYQGVVLVGGTVDRDGTFTHVCVQQAAGVGLDEMAIAAVKNWKFDPATRDGHPVPAHISVEVSFHLY